MSDVRWIKITTDIFDDEKIQLIESMPEGDTLIVIWFKLLVLAGKQNYSGVLALGDKVFYTEDMLTTVFRRKSTTVKLALTTFEQFGMIAFVDGAVTIPNWEKHQNIDGLEKIRRQTRERVARHRQKQKALVSGQEQLQLECNVTETLPVTTGNAQVTQQIKNKSKKENKNILDSSSREMQAYIKPEYYSLLQVIADKYNDKFIYPYNYSMTHQQKILIGQFLSDGYMTSDEVLAMIDRIPDDVESPLAYLISSMERLKEERLLEAKAIAHENARRKYQQKKKKKGMTDYYQLENMLVAGSKSQDEYERYQELKKNYEAETMDYSFSVREITNQLEIMIETRENDFPNLDEALLQEYQGLVEQLKEYDVAQAESYTRRLGCD